MDISVNYKYFENLVHKMEMNYIKNKSSVFTSYWSRIKEQNDTYNKYVSRKYLRNNRGVSGFIPEIKEFKFKDINYAYYIDIAKQIFMRSLYYCPIDTGALKRSAYVKSDSFKYIDIGYSKDYAMYVHEKLDNFHLRPTRAKFLEDAVMDVCNVNGKLWTLNDLSVNIYISYDPLYVRISPKVFTTDMEILFSNYNEIIKNMWEDFDNSSIGFSPFGNNPTKLDYYRYYKSMSKNNNLAKALDDAPNYFLPSPYNLDKDTRKPIILEAYKKGESLADDYNNNLIGAVLSEFENGVSIDGKNYIHNLSTGLLTYSYDLVGDMDDLFSEYVHGGYITSGTSESMLRRLERRYIYEES